MYIHTLNLSNYYILNSVIHILNEVLFRATESSLIRNIVNSVICLSMFTMNTSYLHIVLVSNFLESCLILFTKERQFDVH